MTLTALHSALRARDVERSLKVAGALEQVPPALRLSPACALLATSTIAAMTPPPAASWSGWPRGQLPKRAPLIEIKKSIPEHPLQLANIDTKLSELFSNARQ